MTKTQAEQGLLSLDHDPPADAQVTKATVYQGFLSPDHPITQTHDQINGFSPSDAPMPVHTVTATCIPHTGTNVAKYDTKPLRTGDWVEILSGCFIGRKVEVIKLLPDQPGWVEVQGQTWTITQKYPNHELRRVPKP